MKTSILSTFTQSIGLFFTFALSMFTSLSLLLEWVEPNITEQNRTETFINLYYICTSLNNTQYTTCKHI